MTQWPLWTVLLVPAALTLLGVLAASGQGVLVARDAGRRVDPTAPLRETARLLVQQPRRIPGADVLLARGGLVLLPLSATLAALVVPLGGHVVLDSTVGVVVVNLADVGVWAGLWLAGWGSNSPWGLVGGYRFLAQGLAYELPHMFALITAATGAESLRLADIAGAQHPVWFVVLMPVAFAVYLVSALGLSTWGPFASPLGRDAAGGVGSEYAGVDQLLLRGGRAMLLAAMALVAVPLFLGGGAGPLLPGWLWTLVKAVAVLALLVWLGARGPQVRVERFTEQAWVWLLPLAVAQTAVVAVVVL